MQVELHSHWFHLVIVIFVVLDALIVLFELLLDVGAFGELFFFLFFLFFLIMCAANS